MKDVWHKKHQRMYKAENYLPTPDKSNNLDVVRELPDGKIQALIVSKEQIVMSSPRFTMFIAICKKYKL